jgi:hypothetical protein
VGTHVLNLNSWATWTPSNLTQKPKSLSPHASIFFSLCLPRAPVATCLAASPPLPAHRQRPTARLGRVVPRGARHQAPLRRAPRPADEEPFLGVPKSFPGVKPEFWDGMRSRLAALRPNGPISRQFRADLFTVPVVGDSMFVHGGSSRPTSSTG